MNKKNFLSIIAIVFVIVLSIGMRVMYLGSALWYDEACSWFSAKQDFPFGIFNNLLTLDLQHTPIYFFLLHFWMKIFGQSEVAIKSLSLIFSLLTLPLTYIITRKICAKRSLSFFALTITGVSPLLVYFSAEARMYPMVMFLVLLSVNFLLDFHKKKDVKTLSKLVITNILIPYTFVGGVVYNFALMYFYSKYLSKKNKGLLKTYVRGLFAELLCLIPYFILLIYYAKTRALFVVKHEGALYFAQIVDVIRNFFGANTVLNVYWPDTSAINLTVSYAVFVIVPCVYFIYGIVQGLKQSDGLNKVLYKIFICCFVLAIVTASLQIHVFTSRYILYLLIPFIILGLVGLSKKLSKKHLFVFVLIFSLAAIYNNFKSYNYNVQNKANAFMAVKTEVQNLMLTSYDMVIMPFGSDAAYYFRKLSDPMVLEYDFHKNARNPQNRDYYTQEQINSFNQYGLLKTVFDIVKSSEPNKVQYEYYRQNIYDRLESGHYVVLALYGTDSSVFSKDYQQVLEGLKQVDDVKNREVDLLFSKYMKDLRNYLETNFIPLSSYTKDTYTYHIFQKK